MFATAFNSLVIGLAFYTMNKKKSCRYFADFRQVMIVDNFVDFQDCGLFFSDFGPAKNFNKKLYHIVFLFKITNLSTIFYIPFIFPF